LDWYASRSTGEKSPISLISISLIDPS